MSPGGSTTLRIRITALAVWLIAAGLCAAQPAAVRRYCVACHNAQTKSGNIALDGILADPLPNHADVWEKAIRKLRTRTMPPAGMPRPDEAGYTAMLAWLEGGLDAAAKSHPNPGRTDTFRRLNRAEYHNAIRDLLAVDVDVASLLPSDDISHGFDNITVATLSPTLLERYVDAARKISRLAIGAPVRSPGGDTFTLPPDLTEEQHFDELPIGTRGGLAVPYTFPLDAEYEISARLTRDRNEHVEGLTEAHEIELMLDGERIGLFTVKPPVKGDHSMVDHNVVVRIPVKAGPHMVAAAFPKRPTLLLESERQPYPAHFNMDRHPRPQPAVYSLTVNGPYSPKGAGESPSRKRILICTPAKAADESPCATRILSTVMRRAYRRPVVAADLAMPLKFFRETRASGDFEAGIEMALRSILVSPEFLFRVEQDPANVAPKTAYRVSQIELASRLSFFLWSSIPDDELLEAAVSGKLANAAVLEAQVRRMLNDERSKALVDNFAGQWLYLRNLDSAHPDMRLFAAFDDNLRQSFRRETELFFDSIMREDRSVLDLLAANYTFLNERLAVHYGVPNVYGSRFRKVEFPPDSPRGGLLGQGSILTVTSYATRTSPVQRGKWILSNILGIPPPPPPPVVPALKENEAVGKNLSMRERMAQHRDNPACSGCHKLMDPVGFSLENFDAVGRWRTSENGIRIDASGGLPDGSTFEGVAVLRKALLARPEVFARTFTEKLLTYALGRGTEAYDGPAVRAIEGGARGSDYRFSSFILGVVNSTPFQMRRSP